MQTLADDGNSSEDDKITGAGVVPISVSPNGQVYALLGRENYVKGWSSSLKWSGFEGGNQGDESATENAARELYEESLGLLFSDITTVIEMLEMKNYIARIAVKTLNGTKTHVTYLKYIPWDADLPSKFNTLYTYLSKLSSLGNKIKSLKKNSGITRQTPTVDADGWIKVKSNDQHSYDKARENALEMLNNPPVEGFNKHPAISVCYDDDLKIHTLNIKEEYIEKTQIKYWPLNDLETATKNGGNGIAGASIRPYFCIIAKLICKYVTPSGDKPNKGHVKIPRKVMVRLKPEQDLTYPPGLNCDNIPKVTKTI